jgi:hypothetical protein
LDRKSNKKKQKENIFLKHKSIPNERKNMFFMF